MNSKLIAFAQDVSSFLIQKDKEIINNIILFGSVARNDNSPESDIDLFIDTFHSNKSIESKLNKHKDEFLDSVKYKTYWKLLNINNKVSLTIGKLDDWKELKPSIIANGIVLYGKYKPSIKEGSHKTFFIWENIKPNSKRVLFNKQMFGYKQKNRFYEGMIQKYNGERLGKGCIIVPLEHATRFHQLFKTNKITVKIKKVLEY